MLVNPENMSKHSQECCRPRSIPHASTRGAAFVDENDLGEANNASGDQSVAAGLSNEDGLAISAGSGEQ